MKVLNYARMVTGAALAILAVGTVTAGSANAADKIKAAWVYVGPTGDMGWNYQHDLGRLAVEKALGDRVETIKVENVPESADAERVFTQLAQAGAKIIFATSFGYMDPVIKVAKQFPDVDFEHATGYKSAPNVATYNSRFYEGRFIQGTMAGMITKSGIIGFVAAVPIPEVIQSIDAYAMSARKVRPDVKIKVIYVNEWFNPGKEADAASAMIDQGADVIVQHTDSPAPVQVAERRGAWSFGMSSDMSKFGPTHLITSNVDNWGPYYIARVKMVLDGTWKTASVWGGLENDMLIIPPFNSTTPKAAAEAGEKIKEDLKAGKFIAFEGPIKDQSGAIKVAAGQHLDDGQINSLNWYVEGIEGDLPH